MLALVVLLATPPLKFAFTMRRAVNSAPLPQLCDDRLGGDGPQATRSHGLCGVWRPACRESSLPRELSGWEVAWALWTLGPEAPTVPWASGLLEPDGASRDAELENPSAAGPTVLAAHGATGGMDPAIPR